MISPHFDFFIQTLILAVCHYKNQVCNVYGTTNLCGQSNNQTCLCNHGYMGDWCNSCNEKEGFFPKEGTEGTIDKATGIGVSCTSE